MQSFDWRTLAALKRIAPEIERVCLTVEALNFDTIRRGEPGPSPWLAGLDIDDFGGSVPRLVAAAGCATWSPLYRNARPDDVAAAKALGLKVIPWTVNERADMERLIALGVDGIITDYPDRLRAVMAEKNMPLPPQVKPLEPFACRPAGWLGCRPKTGCGNAMTNPYDIDLDRNPANFQPLTPLTFLERAAAVFPEHTAIIHGPLRRNYARVLCARAPARLGAGASAASSAATRCR